MLRLLAVSALLWVLLAPQASAAAPVTFGVRPATETAPDNRNNFSYGATPGAVVHDFVAVSNVSEAPVALKVYASDAFNTPEGGYDLLAAGRPPVDIGAWTKTRDSAVTIPGRSLVIVPFTLTIPADATPGDHAGGIVAALTTDQTNAQGQKVSVEQRVGARIYLRVAGDLRPELSVQDLTASFSGQFFGRGDATVHYTVRNTGNVRLGATQAVKVSTPWGSTVDSAAVDTLPELLPGGAVQMTTTVHGLLPAGWLTANVHLVPVPPIGTPDPHLADVEQDHTFAAVPWSVLGALVLVALLIVFARWRKRRRSTPVTKEVAESVPA
ncbi:WxL protein peptidoglycan domain-containing protein [Actinocrispum wychmicini]|uniref:Uncharacterized protein DUF916 n=1 Tax=Actinocrispum wychmicini TaxID=1213861 RepID=A0A4R2JQC6_9PSEU|nr:DUF916 domain-containing protein [Actinocrispum wychmicini]TCO62423.1 uncharacterized protein DUF916 [Actinocrispum wychmicini]